MHVVVEGGVDDGLEERDGRVVHEHVERTELRRGGDDLGPIGFPAHVVVHEHRAGTDVVGDLFALVVEDVGEDDPGALAHEHAGFRLTLATRGAGDDRDLAAKSSNGSSHGSPFV